MMNLFAAVALPLSLIAVVPLDLDMTAEDKKVTGVFKLRDKEKAQLQDWIDSRYSKRQEMVAAKTTKTQNPSLSENLYGGSYIRLTDNSLWNIRPEDTPISSGWVTSVEILIAPSGDPQYPYKLTNTLTGSSVLARKASGLPNVEVPPTPTLIP